MFLQSCTNYEIAKIILANCVTHREDIFVQPDAGLLNIQGGHKHLLHGNGHCQSISNNRQQKGWYQ